MAAALDAGGIAPGRAGVPGRVRRADGRGAPARPQPARGTGARCGAVRALDPPERARSERDLAAMSVEAATGGAVFQCHLGRVLLPEPRRAEPDSHRLATRIWRHGLLLQQPAFTTQDPAANASGRLEGSA